MANPTETKKTEPAQAAAPAPSGESAAAVKFAGMTRFLEAYTNYLRQLGEGWEASRQEVQDTYCKHDSAHQTLRTETEKLYAEHSRRHAEEMREAWNGPVENRHRTVNDVQQRLQSGLQDVLSNAAQRWQAQQTELRDAISTSHENYANHCKAAFKSFLNDLKRAWQSVNVDQLDAFTLATIQRLTTQAACHAWHTGAH